MADMNEKKGMDMTQGSPFQRIVVFTIPMILGNIFQQLYNVGDTKVVSYFLNEHAFAAVGMTAVVSNTLMFLVNGFTQGFGILTAAAFGMKDVKRIRRNVAGSAVQTICITSLLMILAFLTVRPLLVLLQTPDELLMQAESYIRIIFIGMPFSALYNLTANQLRSLGDSKVPLYCLLISIGLNLLLDILFVGYLFHSIEGAAYATVASQCVCSFSCFIYGAIRYREYLPKKDDFHIVASEFRELFLTGLSMGLMGCIVNIGSIILQSGINGLGADILAAHTAGRRILDIQMTLVYTFGITMTTYVSQNYGAGRIDRIKSGVRTALGIVTAMSVFLICFSMLFARPLVMWVASTKNNLIIDNAAMYCRVGAWFFPALGPLFVLRCSLQGMGHKAAPLFSSILELCVKIASVAFMVPVLGYFGVALTEPLSWVLMTMLLTIGYVIAMRKSRPVEEGGSAGDGPDLFRKDKKNDQNCL